MKQVQFTVYGIAAAKGNMKSFPFRRKNGSLGASVTEGTKGSKSWQALVADTAQRHAGEFFTDAVEVELEFWLPRPKSLPKRVTTHTKKPDVDKLTRAIFDALKGIIWRDDSQVVSLNVAKGYAAASAVPGVRVVVTELSPL